MLNCVTPLQTTPQLVFTGVLDRLFDDRRYQLVVVVCGLRNGRTAVSSVNFHLGCKVVLTIVWSPVQQSPIHRPRTAFRFLIWQVYSAGGGPSMLEPGSCAASFSVGGE